MKRFALVAIFALSSPAYAQNTAVKLPEKPNLSETNLRDPPKSSPTAGAPADYLLIPADKIGGVHYLRFDIPVKEVRIDGPSVLLAEVSPTDAFTLILK